MIQLNNDEWFHILQFLPLPDLYHFSLVDKYTSIFLKEESYVWQQWLLLFIPSQEVLNQCVTQQYNGSYKTAVRDYSTLKFDTNAVDPAHCPQFLNNGRTVKSSVDLSWNTLRTTRTIMDNQIFAWDSVLDSVSMGTNTYRVFVGLVEEDFPFATQNHKYQIVGSRSRGHAYNVGVNCLYSKSKCTSLPNKTGDKMMEDGDVFTSVVDTRHPTNCLTRATWILYKNGEKIFSLRSLDLTGFSPAVALVNATQVSLRGNVNYLNRTPTGYHPRNN